MENNYKNQSQEQLLTVDPRNRGCCHQITTGDQKARILPNMSTETPVGGVVKASPDDSYGYLEPFPLQK